MVPPVVSWDLQAGIATETAKVQTLASISFIKACKSLVMTMKPELCLLHKKHHGDLAGYAAEGRSCGITGAQIGPRTAAVSVRPA